MQNMKGILKEVLADITPESAVIPEADNFLKKINLRIKKLNISATAVPGGSYAKNTWLKGDHDVDLFVCFNMSYSDKDISCILENILKPFSPERVHGSRDYFHVKNKIKYEIIPVLNIKKLKDAHNVTDFSPLHVKWVNKKGKNLKEDIRIMKKFCKAQNVYGAESYIRGFSGHVIDIIIIHYKGFLNALKAISLWKPKTIIDPEKFHKHPPELVLNKSKIEGPLVIIDPVQPDRNSAAAICNEKYFQLIKSSVRFIKNPSLNSFKEQKFNADALKKKGAIIIKICPLNEKEDVAGTKLLKAFEFLSNNLDIFKVNSGWCWNKKEDAFFWFIPKIKILPENEIKEGPPVKMIFHAERFRKKYKKTFAKGDRLYAKVKRKNRKFADFICELLKEECMKERIKKWVMQK